MSTMFRKQAPYPLDAFHLIGENAAREVRWHLKAPDAMIGASLLTVEAIACQGLADVAIPIFEVIPGAPGDQDHSTEEDKVSYRIPLAINMVTIADSGERKTTVDRIVGAPVYANDEKRAIKYEADLASLDTDLPVWQDIKRGLRRKLAKLTESGQSTVEAVSELKAHATRKPTQPRLRRIVRSDITKTAIAEALHGNGESIALMSNEGDIVLNGEAMKHLSWLNSAWDGATLLLDRANGRNLMARNPRVTTSLLIQPSVFHEYMMAFGKKARGVGHFARYLVAWPRSTQGQRFISGHEGAWKHLPVFHARVRELLEEYDRRVAAGSPKRDVIYFTDEAKSRWIELVNDTEQLIRPFGALREVKDFAAKACEITARVAGIFHYFSGQVGGITVDTLERAFAIVRWHMEECEQLFVPENEVPQALKDAELLRKYFYRIQQERMEHNNDPLCVTPVDSYSIERNEARHCGPLRKGRFLAALEILVAREVVSVGPLKDDPSRVFRKSAGRLYIFYSDRLGYPLHF